MSGLRTRERNKSKPDILDCMADLSNDEVFTPPRVARKMLELLPDEVWSNPDLKWLDPGTKTGVFLREIATRLMWGLVDVIPDEEERRQHILQNMLYGLPTSELTSLVARRTVYYSRDATSAHATGGLSTPQGNIPLVNSAHTFKGNSCTECGAPKSLERGESRENYAYPFIHAGIPKEFPVKFDVIVGNPPYQLGDGGDTSASPVYQKFVKTAIDMDPRYVIMITPSRWFTGGKGLDTFRSDMLSDRRVRKMVDHPDPTDCFPGVDIQAGVNYFLWDRSHDGPCDFSSMASGSEDSRTMRYLDEFDVFVRSNQGLSIVHKVIAKKDPSAADQVASQTPFGLYTNFKDFSDHPDEGSIPLLMRRGKMAWVDRSLIQKNTEWLDRHKVYIPLAYGERGHGPYFAIGKPTVVEGTSVCTQTYTVAGSFVDAEHAHNHAAFLKTRFARFLISLRKATQHVRPSVFAFVPALDMNIRWTDEMLFERYNLDEDEILFIKSQIKEMV